MKCFCFFVAVIDVALTWFFICCVAVQLGYAFYFFTRIFRLKRHQSTNQLINQSTNQPITIIICARNEARNLERNLPAILAQRYTNEAGKKMYEVIVVNDASTDDTEKVLYGLEQEYDQLWHVTITTDEPRDRPGKKYAMARGLEHASHQLLLMTDADCMPASDTWLAQMAAPLNAGREIVAGYGGYYAHAGLLNAFTRWETLHTFLQYSTYALAGKPYMAVGRNMACTKEVYLKAQQSPIWNELPSGDDDLLMATMANEQNTAIEANPEAFTTSEPKHSWSEWLKQKQRHLSTGKYYKGDIKRLLAVYAISQAGMWLAFFALLCFSWQLPMLLLGLRCLVYWSIWTATARLLKEKKLVYLFPLLDIGWMLYNFALSPYIIWKNRQQWK